MHRHLNGTAIGIAALVVVVLGGFGTIVGKPAVSELHAQSSWRGLIVAPEHRCSHYDDGDYPYPQSVEDLIVAELGGVYGPYTGRWFASKFETDIEHMVARSEAHDSGLCAADAATRSRFATDLLNLTLAGPSVNRNQKRARDAAEWLPAQNRCWFAVRVIAVRQRYGLTIDQREANALDDVLAGCTSTELVVFAPGDALAAARPAAAPFVRSPEVIAAWDDNGNGRISCAEARAHGIAPVARDHPAYQFMRDGDGDGVVCESRGQRSAPARAAAARDASGTGCGPFRNCTALRRVHPNGVRRGHCAYQRRMDRDNDGWACER